MKSFVKGLLIGAALVAAFAFASPSDAAINCVYDTDQFWYSRTWHVGDAAWTRASSDPANILPADLSEGFFSCRVDGAEVAYVGKVFTGLRSRKNATVIEYVGEDAVFVFENLLQ